MCFFKYRTARPYEILLISGAGNKNIKLRRKGWIWPRQTCMALNTGLITYTFEVNATSSDKLSYLVPTLFAIGPWTRDEGSMLKYAKFVTQKKSFPYDEIKNLLADTIEGELRALAASMTYEDISKSTKDFDVIVDKAQLHLSKFGIFIYFAFINNHLVYTREQMEAICLPEVVDAAGKRYAEEQDAKAELYKMQKDADALLYQKQKDADALLYAKKKEAEGIKAKGKAQELYIATLLESFGGNYDHLRSYLISKHEM